MNEIIYELFNRKKELNKSKGYTFYDSQFHFYSLNSRDLDKIDELIEEYSHTGADKKNHTRQFEIVMITSPTLFENMLNKLEHIKYNLIKTFKDGIFHKEYEIGEERAVYIEETENPHYLILKVDLCYFIILKNEADFNLAFRVVREVIFRTSEDDGFIMFHAGAVVFKESGIMVCGDKASGKTTMLLSLILNGADYISNDRLLVKETKQGFLIKYFPISMRIGRGTIAAIPQLAKKVNNDGQKWSRPQVEEIKNQVALDEHADFGSAVKLEITSKELKELFAVNLKEQAYLKTVIFPKINLNISDIHVSEMDSKKAAILLQEQCMSPLDENWIEPWLKKRRETDQFIIEYSEKLVDHMIEQTKVYQIEFGKNIFNDSQQLLNDFE